MAITNGYNCVHVSNKNDCKRIKQIPNIKRVYSDGNVQLTARTLPAGLRVFFEQIVQIIDEDGLPNI
jgi:hypothetical protein